MIEYQIRYFYQTCPAMLEAMFTAKVGDDVFGEDPTINQARKYAGSNVRNGSRIVLPKRHYD